jgi:hypothetical protein
MARLLVSCQRQTVQWLKLQTSETTGAVPQSNNQQAIWDTYCRFAGYLLQQAGPVLTVKDGPPPQPGGQKPLIKRCCRAG